MKIIQRILLISIVLIAAMGCEPDRVDTPPLGETEATFFSNNNDFRRGIAGVYAKLYDHYSFAAAAGFSGFPSSLWQLPGDDLTENTGSRSAEELFDGSLNPNNNRISWMFSQTYRLIQKANVMISKTETVDYSDFEDPAEIDYMEGEALFLRGYSYFVLFNIYGNVPIITQRQDADQTNVPKSDKLEVLTQSIEDLRMAMSILPPSWSAEYKGRVTSESAKGMLVKALVFRANYTGDNADLNEAITVYNTMTSGLQARYLDNFDSATENNGESLFEIQSSSAPNIDNIFLVNEGAYRGVENMSIYRGMYMPPSAGTSSAFASSKYLITNKLLNSFGDDPRISYWLRSNDGQGGRLFQKYSTPELDAYTVPFSGSLNNERVLRMADVELLIAEAYLKTGSPGNAITHINRIRTRARNWAVADGITGTPPADYPTSETNTGTIMQWIMDERFVEFAGEGHRWWDLKRWHEAGDIDLSGWDGTDANFSTNLASPVQFDVSVNLIFPIPQDEITRNSAILENNPGY